MLPCTPRTRELIDATGMHLRVSIDIDALGPFICLARPDTGAQIRLDVHGIDLLSAYLMAARIAGRQQLADESSFGPMGVVFSLEHEPALRIEVRGEIQDAALLSIPATLWDRLYAELGIVSAHARALEMGPLAFEPA